MRKAWVGVGILLITILYILILVSTSVRFLLLNPAFIENAYLREDFYMSASEQFGINAINFQKEVENNIEDILGYINGFERRVAVSAVEGYSWVGVVSTALWIISMLSFWVAFLITVYFGIKKGRGLFSGLMFLGLGGATVVAGLVGKNVGVIFLKDEVVSLFLMPIVKAVFSSWVSLGVVLVIVAAVLLAYYFVLVFIIKKNKRELANTRY